MCAIISVNLNEHAASISRIVLVVIPFSVCCSTRALVIRILVQQQQQQLLLAAAAKASDLRSYARTPSKTISTMTNNIRDIARVHVLAHVRQRTRNTASARVHKK